MKFAAVVVTFNRKLLLGECLQALLKQTRQLDAIYVVDNASTDGTPEYLRGLGLLEAPTVRYMRLESNLGGAGGFHAGMKTAYADGFDWIWIMDDDAIAKDDALAMMLPYVAIDQVVAIANQKLKVDGNVDPIHTIRGVEKVSNGRHYLSLTFSSFVGLMVNSAAIALIGLPKAEFFIHADDLEYCNRLIRVGDIALADQSQILHKEVSRTERQKRFLGRAYFSLPTARFCMTYFGIRNYLWTDLYSGKKGVQGVLFHVSRLVKTSLLVILVDREDVLIRLRVIFRAFRDGISQNFDNIFAIKLRDTVVRQQLKANVSRNFNDV